MYFLRKNGWEKWGYSKYFANTYSPMKTMSDTPLPTPRMIKAEKVTWNFKSNFNKCEMNTYKNRNIAYQVLSLLLQLQM